MACSYEQPEAKADESLSFRILELPKNKLCVNETAWLGEFFKTADEQTVLSTSSHEFRTPYLLLPRKRFVLNLLSGFDNFRTYQDQKLRRHNPDKRYWFTNCLEWIRLKGQDDWPSIVRPSERKAGKRKVPFDVVTRQNQLRRLAMLQYHRQSLRLIAYCRNGTVYLYSHSDKNRLRDLSDKERKKHHSREKVKLCFTSDRRTGPSNWSKAVDENEAYFRVYEKTLTWSSGHINILFPARIDAVDPNDDTITYHLVLMSNHFYKVPAKSLTEDQLARAVEIVKQSHVRSKLLDSKGIVYGIRDGCKVQGYDKVEIRDVGQEHLEEGWSPDRSFELLAALLQRIVDTARRYSGKYLEFDFQTDPDSNDDMLVDVKVLKDSSDPPYVFPEWYNDFLDDNQ